MRKQLEDEKTAYDRIWKKREKQIQRITNNTAGMYGDLEGIIGASLPEIEALELSPINKPKQLTSHKSHKKPKRTANNKGSNRLTGYINKNK